MKEKILTSQSQIRITNQFMTELDKHMNAMMLGNIHEKYTIQEFADILHIHPVHLTHSIKAVTGRTPCSFYKEKLIDTARYFLHETSFPISQIAFYLTFDPSNFTKFFKSATGLTPKRYREKTRV